MKHFVKIFLYFVRLVGKGENYIKGFEGTLTNQRTEPRDIVRLISVSLIILIHG